MDADLLEIEEVLGVRYCDPSQMTAVALRNPVDEDDDRLEYLVSGSAGPDDRGFHSVAWFFHGDLLDHAGADTVKAAIQEYWNWIRNSRRWRRRVTRLMLSSRTSAAQRQCAPTRGRASGRQWTW